MKDIVYREAADGGVEPTEVMNAASRFDHRWRVHTRFTMCRPWWKFWKPYDVLVSTVFLAIDHAFGDGPPVLYETMVFGAREEDSQWRHTTRERAKIGHEVIVAAVRRRKWKHLDDLPYMNPGTADTEEEQCP